ncbi:transcription initiation factor IIA, gamma subunit [Ramicandelaber brevisporus]|nr:transcription initiation factor IIA, gamma subunit [Ramicandelaber brevisporus]
MSSKEGGGGGGGASSGSGGGAQPTAYYEIYRRTTLGNALTDALDELVTHSYLTPQLAIRVLVHFDRAFADALSHRVKTRTTLKGKLRTYRHCDDVWTLIVKNITFKIEGENVKADHMKIVSCSVRNKDS